MKTTKELINLIELSRISEKVYKGQSKTVGSRTVFGGQVLAQALNAAYKSVPADRLCHSLHAYFILPGDLTKSIYFHVQNVRDGNSFTTRYIVAKQNDTPIFVMAASFQEEQEGYDHQSEMPNVLPPEELPSWPEIADKYKNNLPERTYQFLKLDRPIEFREANIEKLAKREDMPPHMNVWFKFREIPEVISPKFKQQLLTYVSDYNILSTSLRAHASKAYLGNTQMASLDHAMWFHRETDLNDWLLFTTLSPSASGARGFNNGRIFNRKGDLIASVSQEGLIRPI